MIEKMIASLTKLLIDSSNKILVCVKMVYEANFLIPRQLTKTLLSFRKRTGKAARTLTRSKTILVIRKINILASALTLSQKTSISLGVLCIND